MTTTPRHPLIELPAALSDALSAGEPLTRLRTMHALQAAVEALRWPLVELALDTGHTWAEIAIALDDSELGLILDHLQHTSRSHRR